MKTIFTTGILVGLLVSSFSSFSQTSTISETNPTPSPGFGASYSITSGEGFSSSRSPMNVFPINASNTITTPGRFYYNTQKTSVYCRVTLTPNGNKSVPLDGYTISIKYGGGAGVVQTTTNSSPGITIPNAGATYYFTISDITIPASTNFQVSLTLDLGNATGTTTTVTLSAFSLNGLEHANGVLPVKFSGFDVKKEANGAKLTWNVALEDNVSAYQVEKSTDGTNFKVIGTVQASAKASYNFSDIQTLSGKVYYRIKSIDNDGKYMYSPIASLSAGKASIVLNAFPMPAKNQVTLQHPAASNGTKISLNAEDGRVIKSIIPSNGSLQTVIDLSSVKAGLYFVRFENANGEVETVKVMKQ